ncbi:hypothetical protein ABIA72_002411 [Stenotrophomonas rhizophila]
MVTAALCLSIALMPMAVDAVPYTLDPEDLSVLRETLDDVGEFQQPYPALVDVTNPEDGTVDAAVDVSAGQLDDGTPVIVIEDDGAEDVARFLVLETEWRGLPAGTLLQGAGPTMAVVTEADDDPFGLRAREMLTFIDMLKWARDAPARADRQLDADLAFDDLPGFLDAFTASTAGEPANANILTLWHRRLPDSLLALWQRDGFARYLEDRLMLVDPDRYDAMLSPLLAGSPLEGVDTFHVYAVTAFGQLFVCGENTAVEIVIDPYNGQVGMNPSMLAATDAEERSARLRFLLTMLEVKHLDLTDEHGHSVYATTRDRLGALGTDEVYAPGPAGLVDGRESNLIRQNVFTSRESMRISSGRPEAP